jgi:hypothetical protein
MRVQCELLIYVFYPSTPSTAAHNFEGCRRKIEMSLSLPFRNVTVVGRRAGAEPRRSAAPDRRPIERRSKPHHLSTERAPARSARRTAQPTLNRRASRWSRRRGALWLRCCGSRLSCWSRIIANTAPMSNHFSIFLDRNLPSGSASVCGDTFGGQNTPCKFVPIVGGLPAASLIRTKKRWVAPGLIICVSAGSSSPESSMPGGNGSVNAETGYRVTW